MADTAALDRVRRRAASLARQSDPLGIAAGTYDPGPDDGPTRHRLRNARFGVDLPEVGQRVDRRAHAVRDIFGDLRRRQQIDDIQLQAGQKFSAHYELAYRGRGITPSYGTRFAEGTPLSQVAGAAADESAARAVDYVCLHQAARAALPGRIGAAMMMACDGHSPAEIGAACGTTYIGERASVAAITLLQTGLDILVDHYGMRRAQ